MCDTPLITEYIQTFCIDNQWPFGYIFIFLGIFLFGVIIKLIKQAKIKIKKITKLVVNNYTQFESATGEKIYNFYPTKPSNHFANGLLFRHFKHFQLPHDADDTALIYLTSGNSFEDNIIVADTGNHRILFYKPVAL